MFAIILIVFFIALFFIARAFYRQKQEQQLRDNPPERRVIEVSLPGGVNDSRMQMARFWRKVASATTIDPKARKTGQGQLDLVYLATVSEPKAMPRLSCLIYADPERMDAIKRAIKQTFEDVDVLELEEDPLLPVAAQLRPRPDTKVSEPETADA